MSTNQSYEEKELLLRMAKGDTFAFRQLFDTYRIPLFNFAFEITKSAIDAEDIIQDVFVKIWEGRQRLANIDYARPYIYAIARNQTFDFLKKAARNDDLIKQIWLNARDIDAPHVEALLALKESRQLIEDAVSRLSLSRQQVFRMSREDGLSLDEIAIRMKLSKSRVKNLLVESLKFIRDYLAQHSILLAFLFSLHCNLFQFS